MAKLTYVMNTSLDGFVADKNGDFRWSEPDEEVFSFIEDLVRPFGTYLYGRKMYKTMAVWETMQPNDVQPYMQNFANIWKAADKIVFSKTLHTVATARTHLTSDFDPKAIERLKNESDKDILIGGPNIAGEAIRAGLVDEYIQLIRPIIIGEGNFWLPHDVRLKLKLIDEKRFESGVVYLRYGAADRA
jgi:dihydrofolate reductase